MIIEPSDVAGLDDTALKLMVLAIEEQIDDAGKAGPFWRALQRAIVQEVKDRRLAWGLLELELLNDPDAEGALAGPEDDPSADALRELRGESP